MRASWVRKGSGEAESPGVTASGPGRALCQKGLESRRPAMGSRGCVKASQDHSAVCLARSLSLYHVLKTCFALAGSGRAVCTVLECVTFRVSDAPALAGGSLSLPLCPLPLSPAFCFQTEGDRRLQQTQPAVSSPAPSFLSLLCYFSFFKKKTFLVE